MIAADAPSCYGFPRHRDSSRSPAGGDLDDRRDPAMTRVVLIVAVALAQAPSPVARKEEARGASEAIRTEYQSRKLKVADTADARMKLALWCEQNGLKDEAEDQFLLVTRLDSK